MALLYISFVPSCSIMLFWQVFDLCQRTSGTSTLKIYGAGYFMPLESLTPLIFLYVRSTFVFPFPSQDSALLLRDTCANITPITMHVWCMVMACRPSPLVYFPSAASLCICTKLLGIRDGVLFKIIITFDRLRFVSLFRSIFFSHRFSCVYQPVPQEISATILSFRVD